MSAKERFLKKLQEKQSHPRPFADKSQADIAEFRKRMEQLHERCESWLVDTGVRVEPVSVQLHDLLAGGNSFSVPGITLRYEKRMIKFIPVFLYSQGVTGGVDVVLHAEGSIRTLTRLFMRTSSEVNWSFIPMSETNGRREIFDEEAFFTLLEPLLS